MTRAQWAVLFRARARPRAEAVRARRPARPPADHADPADRPAVRQRPDRAAQRPDRPPRQAAVSDAGRAAGARRFNTLSSDLMARRAGRHRPPTIEDMITHLADHQGQPAQAPSQRARRHDESERTALWLIPFSRPIPTPRRSPADPCSRSCRRSRRPTSRAARRRRRVQAVSPAHPAGRHSGDRRRHRADDLSDGRPLHHDRQRLCRRAEGADHAGHLRQDHKRRRCAKASTSQVGDVLFEIDPSRSSIALRQAEGAARQRAHRIRQSQDQSRARCSSLIELAQQDRRAQAERRRAQERRCWQAARGSAARRRHIALARSSTRSTQLEQLTPAGGAASATSCSAIPICRSSNFRPTCRPRPRSTRRKRDLDHTTLRAPIAGIATQVDNIQLGRYVTAGTPVLSVIDDARAVGRRQSEGNRHHLPALGQKVTDRRRHVSRTTPSTARSSSVSPGTGAQFAILPPQNASGNWVKVVQRVPVRIAFDADAEHVSSCAPA